MVYYEQIDQLKQQYTDKFVVVDESRPELRRFAGQTGVVKTVNMSGRALVQFDAYNNTGWYDIDPSCLKVVDAPLPKPEAKKEKPAAAAKAEKKPVTENDRPAAPAKAGAAPKAGGSVADILAAARGGTKAAPAKPAEASATASAAPAATPAALDPKKMSVADMLAAARGKAGVAPSPAAAPKAEAPKPAAPAKAVAPPPPPVEESAEEEAAIAAPPSASAGGKLSQRDQITTIAAMVAYCRKVDAK
jgi:hypothetical protein